jgi:hypothetical protein
MSNTTMSPLASRYLADLLERNAQLAEASYKLLLKDEHIAALERKVARLERAKKAFKDHKMNGGW